MASDNLTTMGRSKSAAWHSRNVTACSQQPIVDLDLSAGGLTKASIYRHQMVVKHEISLGSITS